MKDSDTLKDNLQSLLDQWILADLMVEDLITYLRDLRKAPGQQKDKHGE